MRIRKSCFKLLSMIYFPFNREKQKRFRAIQEFICPPPTELSIDGKLIFHGKATIGSGSAQKILRQDICWKE